MKKIFAIFAMALMLVATSCGSRQAKTDAEVAADSTAVEVVDTTATEVVPVVETSTEAVTE